jgi:RNA methyltransferase, TrmH family
MPRAETITSAANPLLKDVRRAVQRGSLTRQGWCVAESFHLLEESVRSGCRIHAVLAAESSAPAAEAHLSQLSGIRVTMLPDPLFQSIAATENSQGVMALVSPPEWTVDRLFGALPLVVVLDGVQDAGNAGAMVRAAEAFGATGMLFLKGCVSPHNPKALRASAGSLFRMPLLHGVDREIARDTLLERGVTLYAAMPARSAATPLAAVDLTVPCALIIGNESHGIGEPLRSAAQGITIPTGGVESLNAAVAAGVLLYEAQRQRSLRP